MNFEKCWVLEEVILIVKYKELKYPFRPNYFNETFTLLPQPVIVLRTEKTTKFFKSLGRESILPYYLVKLEEKLKLETLLVRRKEVSIASTFSGLKNTFILNRLILEVNFSYRVERFFPLVRQRNSLAVNYTEHDNGRCLSEKQTLCKTAPVWKVKCEIFPPEYSQTIRKKMKEKFSTRSPPINSRKNKPRFILSFSV